MKSSQNNNLVSIIIPAYNEELSLKDCLKSLKNQSYKNTEIVIIDDGSTDKTAKIIKSQKPRVENLKFLKQKHKGPGSARNLGASSAKGIILVFIDADMTFDKNFIKDLTVPIFRGETIGTFSKNEMVKNPKNTWSNCWNINRNIEKGRMLPKNYPDKAPVFRAILKSEFEKVGGFDTSGQYTDDWSLSRKLGEKSTVAPGAVYYHTNPSSIREVYKQARWIGKNEFISGNFYRRIRSLILYSLISSLILGSTKSILNFNFYFLIFKFVYDWAIFVSVTKSFFKEQKAK